MSAYKIKEVDGLDDETASTLNALHALTFFGSAPVLKPEFGHWWIAYHGKDPVAFAGLTHSSYADDYGYHKRSGVLPDHRGRGLQVRLLRIREQRARRNGWEAIVTDTTDNTASANSLIRAGYKLFDPKHPWAFPNSLYWIKKLAPCKQDRH